VRKAGGAAKNLKATILPISSSYFIFLFHLPISSSYFIFLFHLPISSSYFIFLFHLPILFSIKISACSFPPQERWRRPMDQKKDHCRCKKRLSSLACVGDSTASYVGKDVSSWWHILACALGGKVFACFLQITRKKDHRDIAQLLCGAQREAKVWTRERAETGREAQTTRQSEGSGET
jgi:hypothetical protein